MGQNDQSSKDTLLSTQLGRKALADTARRAEKLARTGEVRIEPNHNYGNVSGMCGVTSASSPVLVLKDKVHGNTATDWMQTSI